MRVKRRCLVCMLVNSGQWFVVSGLCSHAVCLKLTRPRNLGVFPKGSGGADNELRIAKTIPKDDKS